MASHATRQPQPEPQTPTQPAPVDGDEQYDDSETTTPVEPSQPTDG